MAVGIGGGGGASSNRKKTPSLSDFRNSTTQAIQAKKPTPPRPGPAGTNSVLSLKPKPGAPGNLPTGAAIYSAAQIPNRPGDGYPAKKPVAKKPTAGGTARPTTGGGTGNPGTTTAPPAYTPTAPAVVPPPETLPGLFPATPHAPTPGPAPIPKGPNEPTTSSGLPFDQRNAYEMLKATFDQYGLPTLTDKILDYVKQGYDPATTSLMLQNTDEWKQRFAGNEARRKAGLPVLSPAEYLATETAMKSVLKNYGLPATFYDQPGDFAGLIGNNVSPDEVASRARYAWDFTKSSGADQAKQLLKDYYGVDDSHIAAYFLDPTKGQALIERAGHAIEMGRSAARQGLALGQGLAEKYADMGVTQQGAESGFANAAAILEPTMAIARRFGEQYDATNAIEETVGGLASERRKRLELANKETALFAGSGAAGKAFGASTGQY